MTIVKFFISIMTIVVLFGCQMADRNEQLTMVGDEVQLVIPADQVFFHGTPIVQPGYYKVLEKIAVFIRSFPKITIKIAVYTDNQGSAARNLALSRQQAEHIADYLWDQGIDTRLLYTVGYGMENPIASNRTSNGRAQNRRIEISLRALRDKK